MSRYTRRPNLSLDPVYMEEAPQKEMRKRILNLEDNGDIGYNIVGTYWIDYNETEIEIDQLRAIGVDIQPGRKILIEDAKQFLMAEYGHKIEFVDF